MIKGLENIDHIVPNDLFHTYDIQMWKVITLDPTSCHPGPFLQTWLNFNPSMDK